MGVREPRHTRAAGVAHSLGDYMVPCRGDEASEVWRIGDWIRLPQDFLSGQEHDRKVKRMRRRFAERRRLVLVLMATLAMSAVGCGGKSDEEKRAEAREEARQEAAERRAEARRKARAEYQRCDRNIGNLLSALQELDSRLDVGLSYDEYTTEVADVKVVYDRIAFDQLGGKHVDCLTAALPAEKGLNQYTRAAGIWGDCIEDFGCDTDSIEPDLQSHWSRASRLSDRARSQLEAIRRPG